MRFASYRIVRRQMMSKTKSNLYSSQDSEVLAQYLQQIDRIPLLSYDEEYDLALKARNGDMKAREKLASANLRFVVSTAKKYRGQGLPLEDLINEGNIGLLTAIDRYVPEKGYHFISYAVWWIKQSILKALSDTGRAVRLPLNRTNDLYAINKAKNTLIHDKGIANPTTGEIADECGLDEDTVKTLLTVSRDMISFDSPVGDGGDEDARLSDFIQDESESPEESMISSAMTEDVRELLGCLNEKERDIIMKRYGFSGEEPRSLSSIGNEYNLTKERIRQIEKEALLKLKKNGEEMGIRYYTAC